MSDENFEHEPATKGDIEFLRKKLHDLGTIMQRAIQVDIQKSKAISEALNILGERTEELKDHVQALEGARMVERTMVKI